MSDEAFHDFVLDVQRPLAQTAYLLTGDHGHAQDLVQTALLKAYRNWDKVSRADSPLAYMRRVLVTSHVSWRRRRWTTEQVIETLPERAGEDHQARHAEDDVMRRALAQLAPRVRAVVVLRYFEDLTEAETAKVLGCSTGTVSTYAARGLTTLRRHLAPDRQPGPEAATHPTHVYSRRTP